MCIVIHNLDSLSSSSRTRCQRTVIIDDGNPSLPSTSSNSHSKTLVPLETNGIINDVKTGTPCGDSAADGEGDGVCGSGVVVIGWEEETQDTS